MTQLYCEQCQRYCHIRWGLRLLIDLLKMLSWFQILGWPICWRYLPTLQIRGEYWRRLWTYYGSHLHRWKGKIGY
jgi:hypothetical protein